MTDATASDRITMQQWANNTVRDWKPLVILTSVLVVLGLVLFRWWYVLAILAACFALAFALWAKPWLKGWGRYLWAARLVLLVLAVAAAALLGTEQGRDLGAGLLDATALQLLLFAMALLYWAMGNWHAAQIAFDRDKRAVFPLGEHPWEERYPETWDSAHPQGPKWRDKAWKTEWWAQWWPNLLGSAAYLLAATTVAWAGWWTDQGWVVWLPAITLFLVLVALLTIDYRSSGAAVRDDLASFAPAHLKRPLRGALLGILGLAAIAAALYVGLPSGKAIWPHLAAPISAAVFLFLAGSGALDRLYDAPAGRPTGLSFGPSLSYRSVTKWFTLALIAPAIVITALTWYDPVRVGQTAGAVVIAFFAFGAYMTVLEGVWLAGGERTGPTVAFLFLLAAAAGFTRDYHTVRTCADPSEACHPAETTREGQSERERAGAGAAWSDPRPTVTRAANFWRGQAELEQQGAGPVPMIVVATAGGGLRAAYWTALVLERIEDRLGVDVLRRHLFAISGVSGGSVGAVFYAARAAGHSKGSGKGTAALLERDFLGPAVAAMVFVDGPASFLPDLNLTDRGDALERAWEEAFHTGGGPGLAAGFLELFPRRLEGGAPWRPALLLNATHQQTGRRVIASHLKVERHVFLDSWDLHELLKADLPASAAMHNSARFTYISPAGRLVRPGPREGRTSQRFGFLIDGGYFENYGAITALQLARHAVASLRPQQPTRPVIILISSDPALRERDHERIVDQDRFCRGEPGGFFPFERADAGWANAFFNEFLAPAAGILASREAHGTLAAKELARFVCAERPAPQRPDMTEAPARDSSAAEGPPDAGAHAEPVFIHLVMCGEKGSAPPLGWVLSGAARQMITDMIDGQEDRCDNRAELDKLVEAIGNMNPGIPNGDASRSRPSDP